VGREKLFWLLFHFCSEGEHEGEKNCKEKGSYELSYGFFSVVCSFSTAVSNGFFLGSLYPFLFVLSFFFSGLVLFLVFLFLFRVSGGEVGLTFLWSLARLLAVVFLYFSFVSLLFCWNGWFLALGCVCV